MHRESCSATPTRARSVPRSTSSGASGGTTTLLLGTDLAPDADVDAATDVITTFLWGLFIEHLRRPARPVDHRIRDLARS